MTSRLLDVEEAAEYLSATPRFIRRLVVPERVRRTFSRRRFSALVLGDDTLYQEAGYTSFTRGRDRTHVYAVAALEPGEAIAHVRRALAHGAAKQTAHDRGLSL